MKNSVIQWGILGCGHIAAKFAAALKAVPEAKLHGVASRNEAKARDFCQTHGAVKWHEGYEALVADPEIDVVYVATPHIFHKEHSILCLNHGKPVLCEKPFAINKKEAGGMVAFAKAKNLFLMEAMWTRFLPVIVKIRELLAGGAIGEVRMLFADFGFRPKFDPESRLFDPALGGGSLLDVGVYPVSFAHLIFGKPPSRIAGSAAFAATGVDESMAAVLRYDKGESALLSSSIVLDTVCGATIFGTAGSIRIPAFWRAVSATVTAGGKEKIAIPFRANGYEYEAEEVVRCIRDGKIESEIMPLQDSLAIVETMDAIRAQLGLVYPTEKSSR